MNDGLGPLASRGMDRLAQQLRGVYAHHFDRVVEGQLDETLSPADQGALREQMLRVLSSDGGPADDVQRSGPWILDAYIASVLNGMSLRARVDKGYALSLTRRHFADAWPAMKHFRVRNLTREPV